MEQEHDGVLTNRQSLRAFLCIGSYLGVIFALALLPWFLRGGCSFLAYLGYVSGATLFGTIMGVGPTIDVSSGPINGETYYRAAKWPWPPQLPFVLVRWTYRKICPTVASIGR